MLRMKPQERLWLEAEGGKVDLNSGEMENNVKVFFKYNVLKCTFLISCIAFIKRHTFTFSSNLKDIACHYCTVL